MTKQARDRKKLVRGILSEINTSFIKQAAQFVKDVCRIEGTPVPPLTHNNQVLQTWRKTDYRIMQELMWHRHKPVPQEKLEALYLLPSLSKACRTMLESFYPPTLE